MHNEVGLAFLDELCGSRAEYYRRSKWFIGDFEDSIWPFEFDDPHLGNFQIDFRIRLSNGTLLSDDVNHPMLNTFKYWINACVHPDNTRGRGANYSNATAKQRIDTTLSIIDYLLLNDSAFGLTECGLQAITEDHLNQFFASVTSTKSKAESIYSWSSELSAYLSDQLARFGSGAREHHKDAEGIDFDSVSDEQKNENTLEISADDIPLIRQWLWNNGLYRKTTRNQYQYTPNLTKIAVSIYGKTTLRGSVGKKPLPSILGLSEVELSHREYPAMPVRLDDEHLISETGFLCYKNALNALALLHAPEFEEENLSLPPESVLAAAQRFSPDDLQRSRFQSLPTSVTLYAIERAISFHVRYAEQLHRSFDNLLKTLRRVRDKSTNKHRNLTKLLANKDFAKLMHPDIRALGVEKWNLTKASPEERYELLRANKGLGELIRVYYGGTAIVLGALMARRQSELMSLEADGCIDSTGKYLVFRKSKSSAVLDGHRSIVARPIDEIAVEMVRILIRFQESLVRSGFAVRKGKLFDAISIMRPDVLRSIDDYRNTFDAGIDYFCDYFETPLCDGKRYYIRTHQLRRFFALSFFWGSGFGGLDTLRWFLGHTDPEHLYRYITENSPGEVLRHAKSQYVAETIEEHAELAALIKARYGTDDFTLLNTAELEEHIDELLVDGTIDVEPDFLDDANGRTYRIVVVIKEKSELYGR